ncbi:MAG: EscU/YscU/HrcU family type III secretion system export apparatus switch protein [Cellulosilyticaceae bacterium]
MDKSPEKAVALSYKKGMNAPIVVAKGQGYVADNILKEAKEAKIPVYKDEKLAKLLTEIEIGDQVPEVLYDLVAQVLVFVSDMDELYRKTK